MSESNLVSVHPFAVGRDYPSRRRARYLSGRFRQRDGLCKFGELGLRQVQDHIDGGAGCFLMAKQRFKVRYRSVDFAAAASVRFKVGRIAGQEKTALT